MLDQPWNAEHNWTQLRPQSHLANPRFMSKNKYFLVKALSFGVACYQHHCSNRQLIWSLTSFSVQGGRKAWWTILTLWHGRQGSGEEFGKKSLYYEVRGWTATFPKEEKSKDWFYLNFLSPNQSKSSIRAEKVTLEGKQKQKQKMLSLVMDALKAKFQWSSFENFSKTSKGETR